MGTGPATRVSPPPPSTKIRHTSMSHTRGVLAALFCYVTPLAAAPARPAPPLPPPAGTIVRVASETQLRAAVSTLRSNTTIEIAPGTYLLRDALYVNGTFTNVGIRGATNNSEDVVHVGAGMNSADVPFGIWVGGDARGPRAQPLTSAQTNIESGRRRRLAM